MSTTRCKICDESYPLTGDTCHSCLTSHQDQDQDQDQDQGYPLNEAVPGPGGSNPAPGGSNEPTELALLVGEWQDGRLTPAEITLGTMPTRAGDAQRAVADHMRLLMGLRLAAGDARPLPYAASMAVRAGLVPDKGTASAAIRALVRMKVIAHVGELPKTRPGIDGTKLYAPPEQVVTTDHLEAEELDTGDQLEAEPPEPEPEVRSEPEPEHEAGLSQAGQLDDPQPVTEPNVVSLNAWAAAYAAEVSRDEAAS